MMCTKVSRRGPRGVCVLQMLFDSLGVWGGELCVLCPHVISLMSSPQERRERDGVADRKRQMKKEKKWEGDRDQLGDFFLFALPFPLPHTSESNWTKTVI